MGTAPLGIMFSSLEGKEERQSTKCKCWLNPSVFSIPREVEFISHKINHIKVNNSLAFNILTMLYNH